ncbi:MAG: archaemetzincin family Zn-dependent metalloprotease [Deltaproteobacteria bacterium]|nr:archaemetzincin family Zn-dependent metalloprotease [Deltaproteobacteria bacterium]MBW1930350.1 archaemetzincin family Zn-dependent metalloprotease [Deltaproteobacteria bacterium]MBW2025192.1 archaemetzincin family Zn-dependent metalloprotease [Deltaproteobacteria bacterium]MBW2125176.1 archaemetzincin family Zn-dependent metalloprotease [Deltaproteobacteria bacterium]
MRQFLPNTIIISPIGEIEDDILKAIEKGVKDAFGYPTEITPLIENVDFAYDAHRDQYHSTPILKRLSDTAPAHCLKILGIVDVDLFIPILTHVYGEAQLGGKASIISTYRLKKGILEPFRSEKYVCRLRKEAAHELGHTFNLKHCREQSCIMHYCRRIEDVDHKSERFCRYCKILLNDEIKRLRAKGIKPLPT